MSLDFHQSVERYKEEMMKLYQKSKNQSASGLGAAERVAPTVAANQESKPKSNDFLSDFPVRGNLGIAQEDENEMVSELPVKEYHPRSQRKMAGRGIHRPENKGSFSKMEPLAYQDERLEQEGVTQAVLNNVEEETDPIEERNQTQSSGAEERLAPGDPMQNSAENAILNEYLIQNPKRGYLKIEVTTALGALPVPGAVGTVSKVMSDGQKYVIDRLTTDQSGASEVIALPAPDKELSESPGKPGASAPYAEYDLEVKREGFVPVIAKNVPVFDGILSLQPVSMKPLLNSETNAQPDEIIESEPNL